MPEILSVETTPGDGDRTLYLQYAPNGTLATMQLSFIVSALAYGINGRFSSQNDLTTFGSAKAPQPFVSTLCHLNSIMGENDTRPLEFPDSYMISGDDEDYRISNYTAIARKQIWDQHSNQRTGQVIWVDDITFSSGRGLGALVIQPDMCDNGASYVGVSACAVGAQWVNISTHMENTLAAQNRLSPTFVNSLPTWPQHALFMSKAWANNLTSTIGYQNQTVAHNLLSSLLLTDNICPKDGKYSHNTNMMLKRPFVHEGLISSLIANAMSRLGGDATTYPQEIRDDKLPNTDTLNGLVPRRVGFVLPIRRQKQGYAWNMDGLGIKISIPILILYCLYITVHVVYIFILGSSMPAWNSIANLTALSLNSTPTSILKNTSAGVSKRSTFRNLVSVQEVEANKQLELVFEDDKYDRGPLRKVAVGRAY